MNNYESVELKVKNDLRITTNNKAIVESIADNVMAAIADLENAGIRNIDTTNPLILQAIKLYCRFIFDYCGKGSEFFASYETVKSQLMLSVEFKEEMENA